MNIIIHRGTQQIGGCITEISTDNTRILIDMGSELPDMEGNTPKETLELAGITQGEPDCDAVFFTHYHGDHIGLLDKLLADIPVYMGEAAKEIHLALQTHIRNPNVQTIQNAKTFSAAQGITIGDITITPFIVDHSAYDAYMFLIEADGKKILHTGDFRIHGFRGKGVLPMLEKYVGQVDVLIIEGTTLSRDDPDAMTEQKLEQEASALLNQYKYVFVVCSSTNIDRIAAFNQATPLGKYFLCDDYQKEVIDIARKHGAQHSTLYSFPKALTYGKNLEPKMEKQGFCMLVRANDRFIQIMKPYKEKYPLDSLVIYSMWKGYLGNPASKLHALLDGWNKLQLHTSGHATPQAIADVCNAVSPKQAIIPIHTERPKQLSKLGLPYPIKELNDKEVHSF